MYQIDFHHPVKIYFIGIGGISMSGLAELLKDEGFEVLGSDHVKSALTDALVEKGIPVHIQQQYDNITPDIDCVIINSAIRENNPEFVATRDLGLPYLTRAELLGQLMKNYKIPIAVSGTHGKTTTTSMVSEILLHADTDPTLSIGGILKSIGGNIRRGGSEYFVAEACEYTNSFLQFFPKIGIILNVEADHLDFFKDLENVRRSFRKFAELLPQDGCLIINGEIPQPEYFTRGLPCKVITYGMNSSCDYYPGEITHNELSQATFRLHSPGRAPREFCLSVPGDHNVSNAMAAIALADLLGIDSDITRRALQDFTGTDRRFEYKGKIGGVTIVDDYAHHPTEIAATLTAARNYPHRTLWCVFQPHTHSRTKAFLKDFAKALTLADKVVLAEIYEVTGREVEALDVSSELLCQEVRKLGKEAYYFPTFDEIENFLLENCINGDLLITMGAGDVYKIGESLLGN